MSHYIERSLEKGANIRRASFPPEVIEHALFLKSPDVMREYTPHFDEMPAILLSRKRGNAAVRIALSSYVASLTDGGHVSLMDLSIDDQFEELSGINKDLGARNEAAIPNHEIRAAVTDTRRSTYSLASRALAFGSYLNVFPGKFPPGNWPKPVLGYHDTMLVQAFGRNSVTDKELPVVQDLRRDIGDDHQTLEALTNDGFDAGISNKALADVIADDMRDKTTAREYLLQWEVGQALMQHHQEVYSAARESIHLLWPSRGFYPTYEVKADSVTAMDEFGAFNPLELAHPDMMVRAAAILNKLDTPADVLKADVPFDPNSVQAQVRGKLPWTVRETLTRVEHLLFGRVRF